MQRVQHKYKPFPTQLTFHQDAHRFRVLCCGRRWGKSVAAVIEAFNLLFRPFRQAAQEGKTKRQRVWIIAPTFPLVREDWMIAEQWLGQFIREKKLTEMAMRFDCGLLEFKSAEREDEGLRGAGLDGAVLDEAAMISENSWTLGIRPALSDKLGRAVFISTPKGRNWFYRHWLLGQGNDLLWKSWKLPTNERPDFPPEEWQTILRTTPQLALKQEYLAEFLEQEGVVFQGLTRCLRGELLAPDPRCRYLLGVDLARTEDFTVIAVIDRCHKRLVELHRTQDVDWSLQKRLILEVARHYGHAEIVVDSSGVGDPIEEDLRKAGTSLVRGYKFKNAKAKENVIEQLMVAIEQGLIALPDVERTQWLLEELRSFTYERLPSGNLRYQAPSGLHDDGVIALGLALYAMRHELTEPIPDDPKERTAELTMGEYLRLQEDTAFAYQRFPELAGMDPRLVAGWFAK